MRRARQLETGKLRVDRIVLQMLTRYEMKARWFAAMLHAKLDAMRPQLGALCGLLGFFSTALLGCTHYVGRGSDLYYQGRYIEAAHVLEMSEPRLRGADEQDRATYGLYRGATLFRLGDLDGARHWLEYSERVNTVRPQMLRGDQRELLHETMIALRADLDRRAAARGF